MEVARMIPEICFLYIILMLKFSLKSIKFISSQNILSGAEWFNFMNYVLD